MSEKIIKPAISPSKVIFDEGKEFKTRDEIFKLFELLNVEYINKTIFTESCKIFEKTDLVDYEEYNKTPDLINDRSEKYSELITSGYTPPVYIQFINNQVGYGVFAAKDIHKGQLIGEYSGLVKLKHEVKNRTWSWKYPIRGSFTEKFPKKVSLDGGRCGNELRFINHGDKINLKPIFVYTGSRWTNCYIAREFIPMGKELLVSYGKRYWKTRTKIDL